MEFGLRGRKIAVIAGKGLDAGQLEESLKPLQDAGAELHMLGDGGTRSIEQSSAGDYEALLLPGGDVSGMIGSEKMTTFVRDIMEADKPVAAIGTGAALLIAANAVRGRTLATDVAIRDQIDGAGGSWSDKALQVDQKLITSSSMSAVPALGKRLATEFANKLDSAKVDQLSQQSFPASDPPPGPGSIGAASASSGTSEEARPR